MMTPIDWIALLLALLAAVAAAFIGIVVWFGERTNRLRLIFLWLAVFVSIWITGNVLFLSGPVSTRFTIALVSYSAAMFVAVQTLLFVFRLVRRPVTLRHTIIFALGYTVGIVAALPGVIATGINDLSIITQPTPLLLYGLILTAFLLAAIVLLVVSRIKAGRILRRQIKLVLYGVGFASLIGLTFNLFLPIFGNYHFTQLGPAGATVFVATIAYSTARYSLFDVRLAIVRAIAYLATFATLGALYFGAAYVVATALQSPFLGPDQMVLNIAAALVMALLLQPIKKFFDRLTDKVFYRDNYNTDDFFASLNKILSSTSDLRGLLERASKSIADSLKAEQAFFFVHIDESHHLSAGAGRYLKFAAKDTAIIAEYAQQNRDSIAILESTFEAHHPLKRLMLSYRIALILPLFRGDTIVGYFCIGERRSGDYNRRDIRILGTIADELVIAIQNSLAVEEVRELNDTLQQRIDAATKELRASNAQLQKLDEAKDEFISMASHQLRTPLTSIKGYISMIVEGDVGKVSPDQKHLLDEAFISSERMVRLIGDFLNVSRLQTGKFVIDKHPTDLAKVVAQEIESLEPNADARGLKFAFKRPKNFPILNIDENKMQQVIMNFADNAIYYGKEKSTIKVSLSVVKNHVEFTVKDTGIGVPDKEKTQLFNKFFRATNARKQRPDGTGVGLFLAKKVVDAHDGQIIFESKEGKGSTFGFRLPIPKTPPKL